MANDNLYTKEEFISLKGTADTIVNHIPTELTDFVWNNYKKISGSLESKPCNCGSAAALWLKGVNTIRTYINENKEKYV
jgi:hypothetical protein